MYADMNSSKTGKGTFKDQSSAPEKNMANDAILRIKDTSKKLIQQQRDLTVKPSESATLVANQKNSKSPMHNRHLFRRAQRRAPGRPTHFPPAVPTSYWTPNLPPATKR